MGGRMSARSQTTSRATSLDPSAFALAAASIAAAAVDSPTSRAHHHAAAIAAEEDAAEVERRDLQQHLQHLRMAADAAQDMKVQLLQHAVQVVEASGVCGGESDPQEVDEDLARFTLLEQELRDMQVGRADCRRTKGFMRN